MQFIHNTLEVPPLVRKDYPGMRVYTKPDSDKPFVSITTVISHNTKHKFVGWREKKGDKEANRITTRSTKRGTKTHSLIEHYVSNLEIPTMDKLFSEKDDNSIPNILNEGETVEQYKELPYFLFENLKPELNKINNIRGIEIALYSEFFGIAGTSDCIADYNGKLSIIDYKGSEYIKRKEWIFDYFVQAVAYRYMLKELTGLDAEQLVILMTAENGETKAFVETEFSEYTVALQRYISTYWNDKSREIKN
jgi:genome maintenance exonuclease 1